MPDLFNGQPEPKTISIAKKHFSANKTCPTVKALDNKCL